MATAFKTWTVSLKFDALHLWELTPQHRRDKLIMIFHTLSGYMKCNDCRRFRGRIKEKYFICWFIIIKPQPNLHSGDTYLGPEGVPWIKVPLYNKSVSAKNCMACVILGYFFVNPAPLPAENVKCKNVNFCSTLAPATRIRSCLKTEIFFSPFSKTSASTRCGFESFFARPHENAIVTENAGIIFEGSMRIYYFLSPWRIRFQKLPLWVQWLVVVAFPVDFP